MTDILAVLGNNIRTLRKGRKISQEDLAHNSRISAAHLSKIERGLQNSTVLTLANIADNLCVEPIELFSDHPSPTPQYEANQLARYIESLTAEEQNRVLATLRIWFPERQ